MAVVMKRKIIKYIFSGVFFGLLTSSCSEDFLDKIPPGVVSDRSLADTEGIESLLISTYAELDGQYGGFPWNSAGSNWIWGDVYADDAYKGSEQNDQKPINYIERYKQTASNIFYDPEWISAYDGVSRSNDVLRVVYIALGLQTIKSSEAVQFQAEARFLRAYYHLEALKMWDFVPFIDENEITGFVPNRPSTKLEANAGDTPWGQLGGDGYIPWEEVEKDLQFAIDNLPLKPRNGHVGRADKYAAQAILAKVKLFQGDYAAALILLNEIIEMDEYSLTENFHDNFRIIGNNNSESIFQIQASVNEGGTFDGVNGNYGDILNFPNSGGPGKCCGFNQPSQNLVNAFKTTDGAVGGVIAGLPYLGVFNLDFNASGDDVKNDDGILWSESFTPDTRPLDPRLDWTVGRRGIPYLDWGTHPGSAWIPDQAYAGPYSSIKHVYYSIEEGIGSQPGWGGGTSANNYSIIRYADVLLMAAECEVEENNLDNARELVNEVRGRMVDYPEYWVKFDNDSSAANYVVARYPTGGYSDPFQTQEGAREAVRFERRLELAMEGHRFWDLKKWGVAKSTLNAYLDEEKVKRPDQLETAFFNDWSIRHPIPQNQIDISKGTFTQNPEY
jgi:tetratricopeptide (TPR) repeat protein